MEYASKGVAGSGLGLGIAGTALGLLNGGVGTLLGGAAAHPACSENMPVSRYEMDLQQKIAEQGSKIGLLEADKYTDQKIVEVYNALNPRIDAIKDELRDIAVYQATNTATVGCLANQVNGLQGVLNSITKTVVPNGAICPGWGDVTVTVTPTTTPTT